MAAIDEAEIENEFRREHGDGSDDVTSEESKNREDILLLKHAFLNEKGSPELLKYEGALVLTIKELLATLQDYVDEAQETVDDAFASTLHQIYIDRVKYLLVEYHRIRLAKIQRHALLVLSDEAVARNLSCEEAEFAKAYLEISVEHLKRSALSKFPRIFQKLTASTNSLSMVSKPDLERFVFCRVEETIGEVDLDDSSEVTANLQEGKIYALQYIHIRNYVATGKILLL